MSVEQKIGSGGASAQPRPRQPATCWQYHSGIGDACTTRLSSIPAQLFSLRYLLIDG
jgi:hypothetical protein